MVSLSGEIGASAVLNGVTWFCYSQLFMNGVASSCMQSHYTINIMDVFGLNIIMGLNPMGVESWKYLSGGKHLE
ncbi:hypothetical protein DAPPUDRAFT_317979 [Daphnia pulex]|uniref:Uncharacterized protein n=1 Tax=Daphnia pulex TaxID=6669 RepID=E9GHI0_DAPPU|nr:hypothetical protein DAPPUDRAFT_317979 [Daphnia pulex]|eukprot:EFX80852.1 hypothetical protein DAPPUDRAFT_317979 [Daphnia pulex]